MRTLLHSLRVLALGACLILAARAADAAKKNYDLPAGDAAVRLQQFSEASGRETLFAAETVRGVRTAAVKGEFTPREALDRMLAGTGLEAVQDAKSGALAVKRAAGPNAPRVAQPQATTPTTPGKVEDGKLVLEAVQVTGSRIRGLLDGATAQPVLTFDSKDIERTGAQSLGDLFRYIPQVSSFTTGQTVTQPTSFAQVPGGAPVPSFGGLNTGAASRTTATLFGTSNDGTLLLVDGRRVPKNNQSNGGDGYDLNGIPLAAIDRIEVLLDGASSIYGADAIGGVINIILKKNYRGTELRVSYDNTFDQDAGVLTTSLTHGFGHDKVRGLITLSYETANSMALRDRSFTASYDRRPFGGQDLRGTVYGGAGRVSITGSTPLPGLTTTSAAVPAGTNGTNLTVADYAASGTPVLGDLAQFQGYNSPYTRKNAVVNLSYEYRQWLEVYTEVRAGQTRNEIAPQPIQAVVSVPAGYPGNPFGIAVTLSKYFFNAAPVRTSIDDTFSAVTGVRGRLPHDWHYDASINYVRGRIESTVDSGTSITTATLNAAIAAGQKPNLFYDSTTVADPNAAGLLASLTTAPSLDDEITESWIYSATADGPVYTLPAGKIAVATGVEYRQDYTDFPDRLATDKLTALPGNQQVKSAFAEVNVPLAAPAQKIPFLNQLNLSGSFRREDYSIGGGSSNPRGGLAWRPLKWLLLRGSYGEGFKVPNLVQTNQPMTTASIRFSGHVDPLRGNEPQTNFITEVVGGNPDLKPEKSKNTGFGAVLDVPGVKGLSLSYDWFDNKFVDAITLPTFEQMLLYFPERVTRGPNLPTDQPGWPGPVTGIDYRDVNIAYSRVQGYDISVKLDRTTPLGDVLVSVTGTKYQKNEFVAAPGTAPSVTVNTDSLPVQISGSAFFAHGPWSTGTLATYRAANRSLPTVIATPAAIRWDWQFSYDFDKAKWFKVRRDHWYGKALQGTKLSLTVFDVFNAEPPLNYLYLPDNTTVDALMRRYGISLRKQF